MNINNKRRWLENVKDKKCTYCNNGYRSCIPSCDRPALFEVSNRGHHNYYICDVCAWNHVMGMRGYVYDLASDERIKELENKYGK